MGWGFTFSKEWEEWQGQHELFSEGVISGNTKIRPWVPKKTLAPTKASERGSSAWNVAPGRAPAGLGYEVSPVGPAQRVIVTGTLLASCHACSVR